jgi:hypothetical protein
MNQKLLSIKKQVSALREANGPRAHIPTHRILAVSLLN